jgi:hypothetical protein
MINNKEHPLGWSSFMYELEDAHEHLCNLIANLGKESEYSEVQLRIELGHVYAHLNRSWYRRNMPEDFSKDKYDEQRDEATKFPTDLEPIG